MKKIRRWVTSAVFSLIIIAFSMNAVAATTGCESLVGTWEGNVTDTSGATTPVTVQINSVLTTPGAYKLTGSMTWKWKKITNLNVPFHKFSTTCFGDKDRVGILSLVAAVNDSVYLTLDSMSFDNKTAPKAIFITTGTINKKRITKGSLKKVQ